MICTTRFWLKKKTKHQNITRQIYPKSLYPISKYGMAGNPSIYLPTINGNACTSNFALSRLYNTIEKDKFYDTQVKNSYKIIIKHFI